MKIRYLTLILAGMSSHLLAVNLLPASPGDMVPTTLLAAKSNATTNLDHTPVSAAWKLDGAVLNDGNDSPFVAKSREYWSMATAEKLASGITLHLSAVGAVIRLSPTSGGQAIDLTEVTLLRNGRSIRVSDAAHSVLNPADVGEGSAPFPEGTAAFRLDNAVGAGDITLQISDAAQDVLVHVFEPNSSVALSLSAKAMNFSSSDSLHFDAAWNGIASSQASRIGGVITAPNGESRSVTFVRNSTGTFSADLSAGFSPQGAVAGLYELHAFATIPDGKGTLLRDAKTAFAIAVPTAKLAGNANVTPSRSSLSIALALDVASASRFAVDATLYLNGKAVAQAQSAAWLEAGLGAINVNFPSALFDGQIPSSGLELRDVRLTDQASLSVIERRERALVIAEDGKTVK
jgi:hypothetical protein